MKLNLTFAVCSLLAVLTSACNNSNVSESDPNSTITDSSAARFAGGVRGLKILFNTNTTTGSFTPPTVLPTFTPIPASYPGSDGVTQYHPGVSATQYFALDGVTVIPKPSWLLDFQVGVTNTTASSACATFGGNSNNFDVANTYRVSEANCASQAKGVGSSLDPIFTRIVLDRDSSQIGTAENIMVQVEYQASAIRLNSDGTDANVENNIDQLWKIFWNNSLNPSVAATPFSVFVPPNYSACMPNGTGTTHVDSNGAELSNCVTGSAYRGAPIKTRQFIIPISAYPTMKVIQLSRVNGRINHTDASNYVSTFCGTDSPLCLGIVIYSVTLTRM